MHPNPAVMTDNELKISLAQLLGEPVISLDRIGGGGNSRVYRVNVRSGAFAAKHYFQRTADGRDRLSVELSALQFLWDNKVRCIPQPVAADKAINLAVFQHIQGEQLQAHEVVAEHIDQLTDFLIILRQLAMAPLPQYMGSAAEASFTLAGVADNIRERLNLLLATHTETPCHRSLQQFLLNQFIPELSLCESSVKEMVGDSVYFSSLPANSRTLSPSDFGFHNALWCNNQRLFFLDFEYFGWDDPAKLISDFMWHPRSCMADALKKRFAQRMMAAFSDIPEMRIRVSAALPLFGLKWCMILLNEFRPENLARRRFANSSSKDTQSILAHQLRKAENTLNWVNQGLVKIL